MSRAAASNPFGKCDRQVKSMVDTGTHSALEALAFAADKPISEYIRDLLQAHVHGHAVMLRSRMKGLQGANNRPSIFYQRGGVEE